MPASRALKITITPQSSGTHVNLMTELLLDNQTVTHTSEYLAADMLFDRVQERVNNQLRQMTQQVSLETTKLRKGSHNNG